MTVTCQYLNHVSRRPQRARTGTQEWERCSCLLVSRFAAIKMTALRDVAVLEHITNTLHKTRRLFRKIGSSGGAAFVCNLETYE